MIKTVLWQMLFKDGYDYGLEAARLRQVSIHNRILYWNFCDIG